MSKRPREKERSYEQDSRPPKRPKPDHSNYGPPKPQVEEIHFARQLQELLSFRQDGVQQLRNGIASFKAFLESILYHREEDDRARQISILREYLESERPKDPSDPESPPVLAQLWQAWSFANQNNNDHLVSAVAAVLALLIKTLSGLLDLREHGFLVCRAVLQHQNLRLIKRGIGAPPKQKEFVISPCLRLLTEVTSFDGGALARQVYKRREQTFDIGTVRRNLGVTRTDVSEEEAKRRPSVRTLTVRYVLALLKYLHEGGVVDLLRNRAICTALFQHLRGDPADVVHEILAVTEQGVLKDEELPRSVKAAILQQQNLERVTEVATRSQEGHAASERAFAWLKAACTKSSYGVLRNSGWYPPATSNLDQSGGGDSEMIDLGLDSVEFYDRTDRPDVRNTTLLSWILTLRPHSSTQERELLLSCFRSTPELVAAYFAEKNMQLDPKLTNTWIGYASFLFEVLCLSVPECFGHDNGWAELPPQTNVIIESILPRPLTQKVLTRCLNQNSELVTFFAVRILVLAFRKLAKIQEQLQVGAAALTSEYSRYWHEASERLTSRFVERSPQMKDVISAFRKVPDDDEYALQREAVTRLLLLYYEVTPLLALEEQFDISSALTTALVRTENTTASNQLTEMRALELEHLLQIARHSPGMRWFTKQGSLEYSPIVTLLKIHCKHVRNRQVRDLISHVLSLNYVIESTGPLEALLGSLTDFEDFVKVGAFLDDCFLRATRKPVKYLDDLEAIRHEQCSKQGLDPENERLPSVLIAVFMEQAPYVFNKDNVDKSEELRMWLSKCLNLLLVTEESGVVMDSIQEIIARDYDTGSIHHGDFKDVLEQVRLPEPKTFVVGNEEQREAGASEPTIPFIPPAEEPEDHPELYKWSRKDLDLALEEGDIEPLILCLCSRHVDIRKQTQAQLHDLTWKVHASTHIEKDQLWVLIGSLVETYEQTSLKKNKPLPYLVGCWATRVLKIQLEPSHFLYPKLNRFLMRAPEWRIDKMPTYWIEKTINDVPDEDDAYWKEVQWVLDWLVDGLRTSADLELLRRGNVFEKVMSVCSSPGAAVHKEVKERVLEMVWRITFIENGSTTLITRAGILPWLDVIGKGQDGIEAAIKKRVLETCDRARIEEWSEVKLEEL